MIEIEKDPNGDISITTDGLNYQFLNKSDGLIYDVADEAVRVHLESVNYSDMLGRDALVMTNARKIIKAHKRTSNGRLHSYLFGTGCGTARERCRELGLDPDDNITNYNEMMKFLSGGNGGEYCKS